MRPLERRYIFNAFWKGVKNVYFFFYLKGIVTPVYQRIIEPILLVITHVRNATFFLRILTLIGLFTQTWYHQKWSKPNYPRFEIMYIFTYSVTRSQKTKHTEHHLLQKQTLNKHVTVMLHEIRSMEMFSNELKGVFRLSFHHIIQNTYTVPNAYRNVQEVNRIVQETNELYRTRSIPFL